MTEIRCCPLKVGKRLFCQVDLSLKVSTELCQVNTKTLFAQLDHQVIMLVCLAALLATMNVIKNKQMVFAISTMLQ
jgi:hypothetical protein